MHRLSEQLLLRSLVTLLIVVQAWVGYLRLPGVCLASGSLTEAATACMVAGDDDHDHGCLPQPATHEEGPCCSHQPIDDAARPLVSASVVPGSLDVAVPAPVSVVRDLERRIEPRSIRATVRPPPDLAVVRITQLLV